MEVPIFWRCTWAIAFIWLTGGVWSQNVPSYLNIAENRTVTVNATCGEGVPVREVYCKLVGYDRLESTLSKYDILDGQICDYCYPSNANESSEFSHPIQNVVDGDHESWWQSPPISRGFKYNRVTLDIDLQQIFQVAYVHITMANSPRPGVWAIERSVDHGKTFQPWQYFAGNDVECQKYFGMYANAPIQYDDQVICSTEFSDIVPIENGEIIVQLISNRPSARNMFQSQVLQDWILATNIRIRLIQTKTMLGHLMSKAQGDKTVTRRYYYSIKEISVSGRCVCNGHAYVCPPSRDNRDLLQCQCLHNTAGINCDQCAEGFTQKKWRQYTKEDPYTCEPCNCHGHSNKCYYDPEVDANRLSMDIHGNYEGGGVCQECQRNTAGINCETCTDGFFRPENVFPNDTEPCIPCQCGGDHRYTGNCAPDSGECECKPAFQGAEDCTACADGYYDYPECKPCDCFANGTILQDNGMPFCVAEGVVQCPCLENFSGAFCDQCAEGYFNFPECTPCECNPQGSVNQVCNLETGQCPCSSNYGSRQCDQCQNGYYSYPSCNACNCDPMGTVEEICDKDYGQCLCKEGFAGERCDQCEPGWYNYPSCTPCECSDVGSNSEVCDPKDGQCPCLGNFGGRQCVQCSPGYFEYPLCKACNCDSIGSRGLSCDDTGNCNCHPDFVGTKCDQCAPKRYNYPRCEECNCDPDGVTPDFFALGGCDSVPAGSLCTCKDKVTGRICDTCKPLYWNLQGYNPEGCENCGCHTPGTIGSVGVCDTDDGQCACKPNVGGTRICDQCYDGFFGLMDINGMGCDPCQCDVGGTQLQRGEEAICDKESGQCRCRPGLMGRKCNEVMDTYYIPTLHQFQHEIEDGYRRDGSPVRIGYDDAKFPGYSWKGYGAYSQLQNEVLQDIGITNPAVYRMVIRYINPNPTAFIGEINVTPRFAGGGEMAPGMGGGSAPQPIAHKVLLSPTGGDPTFVSVSGDIGIYPSPFDLKPGQWSVALKIKNDDPMAEEVLVDYFVLVPNQYYEPSILNEHVYNPCIAGEVLPYCRDYVYPDVRQFPTTTSEMAQRPGGGTDVYAWSDRPDIQSELGSRKLATLARWQPDLEYEVSLNEPEKKHVLAVVYFTPEGVNDTKTIDVFAKDDSYADDSQSPSGQAYIFNCPYSRLCRQVVIGPDGKVAEFDFNTNPGLVKLSNKDDVLNLAVDSVVAIPIDRWSLDFVTPDGQCVKVNGRCLPFSYPDAPDQSQILPFVGPGAGTPANYKPPNMYKPEETQLLYVSGDNPIVDITGAVPQPGYYVLVANYYQPDQPKFDLNMNITYGNPGEALDVEELLAKGQYHEAVLPLPTCNANTGCRTVIKNVKDKTEEFNLPDLFHIQTKNPEGKPVWLESVIAIPSENYKDNFLQPAKMDKSLEFAQDCGQNHFYVDPRAEGFCREAIISVGADFNGGALDCQCDSQGSIGYDCAKIGGQCNCKPNVIGRQCTRCKPGFFGFPDCKQCRCPPTARCDEQTGDCICAPHVTGTPDNPCSTCEENTFGYDPITGCQECKCVIEGTMNANMSCSLETGNCFCEENVEGRTCDHCSAGFFRYPDCEQCPCDLRGTTEEICNQETSACLCKPNVEGAACDTCQPGKFNLQEGNPDGCTDCFCFGKTTFCRSHDSMRKKEIYDMDNWQLHGFNVKKTLTKINLDEGVSVPNYNGELALAFDSYASGVDLSLSSLYFQAPESYLREQIFSYGNNLKYSLIYSGYEFAGTPKHPDVILTGDGISLLFYSGRKITPNTPTKFQVPLEPYYWVLPSGSGIDRSKLMVVLNNLDGIYIRANYALDPNGQARLSDVILESAEEVDPGTEIPSDDRVSSVEVCECPMGYHGTSCEDCSLGYYRKEEGPFGPICVQCNCHGHAEICHPLTGECVQLQPINPEDVPGSTEASPEYDDPEGSYEAVPFIEFCHFRPDLCEVATDGDEPCLHNTTGPQCEKCAVGYYGDARRGTPDDCRSCPCPLPENNFATSCDALMQPASPESGPPQDYCVCQPNYMGDRCQFCGPGYYGQPESIGDYCKPCECNNNINVTDPDACDMFSGICQNCLEHTFGDSCERCEPWYYGDALTLKNCQECLCDKMGTELCDHNNGFCQCLPGVEGEKCDRCMVDHWGFESGPPGCTECQCSDASESTSCDLFSGQCRCKPGVTGQKCDTCMAGYWNLGPNGCESCGCNTEFAVGGTCDQETGQCQCLEGVIGQNCDHCPNHWVLVVNETRTSTPEWKRPFNYREGCFPCSSCVSDLLVLTEDLNRTLTPISQEFGGAESSFFAFKRLKYIEEDVTRLQPEIDLLDPQEGSKRLQPLENRVSDLHKMAKSLNVNFKLDMMRSQKADAIDLYDRGQKAVQDMNKVSDEIARVTKVMREIADGLGSGVTPEQLETSVKLGKQWLEQIREHDFSEERNMAIQKQMLANEMEATAKDLFQDPVAALRSNASDVEQDISALIENMEDLRRNAENATIMIREASALNFRNSDPPASFKSARIASLLETTENSNKVGLDLVTEADVILGAAKTAFEQLASKGSNMGEYIDEFNRQIENNQEALNQNYETVYMANNHAIDLERQAQNFNNILANAKAPAARTLDAVTAYDTIIDAVNEAQESADSGFYASESAEAMSVGVGDKAAKAKDRTQELYDAALEANEAVRNELDINLRRSKSNVQDVEMKTKVIKQGVESITKGLESLPPTPELLKETVDIANDAETVAHDSLSSINARADEITRNIAQARNLQDHHEQMKFSLEATKKALDELESQERQKRDTADIPESEMNERLASLNDRQGRVTNLQDSVKGMIGKLKDRLGQVRFTLGRMDVGMEFDRGSNLEVETPEILEELAVNTQISAYFNVSRASDDDRAFLLYIGNEEDTHSKMPHISTDDYMALEVVEGGFCKLTVDLGAGYMEVKSSVPIVYDQWNYIEIERQGHTVTMTLKQEEGPGEVNEDKVQEALPRYDENGRPFGSVFNLHPEYSRIFVGGFPNSVRIQSTVHETFMQGQVEGLKIGGQDVGLWNYKMAKNVKGAPGRNKFKEKPQKSVRFGGQGFMALDRNNFLDMDDEFSIKLKFKPESPNGILLVMGSPRDQDFVALEMKNQYLRFSFNLGDGVASVVSDENYDLGTWHYVEIKRQGRMGSLSVNNELVGNVESYGDMAQLSVESDIYLGGYPGNVPYPDVDRYNFTGCMEEVFIGLDSADLNSYNEAVGIEPGCVRKTESLVTFSPSSPGHLQLHPQELLGTLEISLMFRTSANRGMLVYAYDSPNHFYFVSLSLMDGSLELRVFPDHVLSTANTGSKSILYNDNTWHTVTIYITKTDIHLHADDYEHLKITVENPEQIPKLDERYNIFMGDVPGDINMIPDALPSNSPFIGCVRDVLVEQNLTDFNMIPYHTGLDFGICKSDALSIPKPGSGSVNPTGDQEKMDTEDEAIAENEASNEGDKANEEDGSNNSWELLPPAAPPPEYFGQCTLPINPAPDLDVSQESGLRFGAKKDTYLEFNTKLKVKKRGEFNIDFRTTQKDGVIFYVADERNMDFIALFMKDGKLIYGFNCGSGSGYIESRPVNDGAWHTARFNRQGDRGSLFIDGNMEGEQSSYGSTKNIEVLPQFYLGGLRPEAYEDDMVKQNLMKVDTGFVGCLRNFLHRGKPVGKWSKNHRVISCSQKVEPGYFIGPNGGSIMPFKKFRVGLDFDITLQIKPRNISGLLLAVQGRRDYLILQMVDGAMSFTVDNGRGAIVTTFKPNSKFQFCDGQWHEIHAVKAKNVVTLSVDGSFTQPGIGVPGVSSTDTNHGLFIGGHPKADRLTGLLTDTPFVGCVRNIVIEGTKLDIEPYMLKGDVMSHVCPTI